MNRLIWLPLLMLGLVSCASVEEAGDSLSLVEVGYDDLVGWEEDNLAEVLPALRKSCEKIAALPETRSMGFNGKGGVAADWRDPCDVIRRLPSNNAALVKSTLERWFQPYLATTAGGRSEGLFTGYCQAELNGSRKRSARYSVPLYARPEGLSLDPAKSGEPYRTRSDIEKNGLGGKAKILLWLDDPVDAHILHIQGSGRIRLDDGSVAFVGFDGSNGWPFQGLGRILIDSGKLEKEGLTMQAVRAWLKSHPDEAPALMAKNNRYIFFRLLKGSDPIGAQGVALTAGRSLAVDPAFITYGAPVWIRTIDPDGKPLARLMVAQDAGSAIKGPVRGDYYWGSGEKAFEMAGRMKSVGHYYLLLPRRRPAPAV